MRSNQPRLRGKELLVPDPSLLKRRGFSGRSCVGFPLTAPAAELSQQSLLLPAGNGRGVVSRDPRQRRVGGDF